jgi:hypothetical protein
MRQFRLWLMGLVVVAGVLSPGAAQAAVQSGGPAEPGTQLWASQANDAVADAEAVSPNGATVFVTGVSAGEPDDDSGLVTIAYDAATGNELWQTLYPSFPGGAAMSMAVSPDGSRVFVTGSVVNASQISNPVTIAYDAITGRQFWASNYAPSSVDLGMTSVAVSPDGRRVFAAGSAIGPAGNAAYLTIAYSAVTGNQQWVRLYNGPARDFSDATSVAVSPAADAVFVTGTTIPQAGPAIGYATIAYNPATGATLWTRHYYGLGIADGSNLAVAVAASPTGGAAFVTGTSTGAGQGSDYATIAYDASTGATLWKRRYNGLDRDAAEAVSPDGTAVFVTGASAGAPGSGREDYATVGYNAVTGATLWERRYDGPAGDNAAKAVAVSPDGSTVYVTGESKGPGTGMDYATVAYNAATGAQRWASRYNDPGNLDDDPAAVAVSPATGNVFVTGNITSELSETSAMATVAYRG